MSDKPDMGSGKTPMTFTIVILMTEGPDLRVEGVERSVLGTARFLYDEGRGLLLNLVNYTVRDIAVDTDVLDLQGTDEGVVIFLKDAMPVTSQFMAATPEISEEERGRIDPEDQLDGDDPDDVSYEEDEPDATSMNDDPEDHRVT